MQSYLFMRLDGRNVRIRLEEVIYLKAELNYTRLVMDSGQCLVSASLRYMGEFLPVDQFCRVHRSYIVNLDRVESFKSGKLYFGRPELAIPIGDMYKKEFERHVFLISSDLPG